VTHHESRRRAHRPPTTLGSRILSNIRIENCSARTPARKSRQRPPHSTRNPQAARRGDELQILLQVFQFSFLSPQHSLDLNRLTKQSRTQHNLSYSKLQPQLLNSLHSTSSRQRWVAQASSAPYVAGSRQKPKQARKARYAISIRRCHHVRPRWGQSALRTPETTVPELETTCSRSYMRNAGVTPLKVLRG
jgi:hypothetical protein